MHLPLDPLARTPDLVHGYEHFPRTRIAAQEVQKSGALPTIGTFTRPIIKPS
jgi:hypothetical protein